MKTLIPALVLTLTTNAASAIEIYGGFAGPDNAPEFETAYSVDFKSPAPSDVDFGVSLYALVAGNPDSDSGPVRGYAPLSDPTAPRYTSLDVLTFGNPDSGTGVRIEPEPSVEVGNIITSSDRGDDSGV
jgi:hypothetical protein